MLAEQHKWIAHQFDCQGDPRRLLDKARKLEDTGSLDAAATIYDLAYGLDPAATDVVQARARLLDQLAIVEHGLEFRYIPGGAFLMGCDTGAEDERPCHPVGLMPYWISATPVSWAAYCRLMDWEPPPNGQPRQSGSRPEGFNKAGFHLNEANKIRLQYCEDHTTSACRDWHAHATILKWQNGGQPMTAEELFGTPPRDDPLAAWEYNIKPMVAVAWQEVDQLASRLSTDGVHYSLPTEAQWEKAARGGLIGARYAWGNEPPTHDCCDFDRFREFSIRPMTTFPQNGYGLYAMCGGVWEWTSDWYDRDYYQTAPETDRRGPAKGEEKALRGGSWADCADAVTVSFRMSRGSRSWDDADSISWGGNMAPNIGFRLCRFQQTVSPVPGGSG